MENIEILSLADNYVVHPGQSFEGTLGEHGLSFLVSGYGRNILFDTGSGLTIEQNARILGLNWETIDAVILSHAHDDHTGGLETVMKHLAGTEVFVHPAIFRQKYAVEPGKEPAPSGMFKTKEAYEAAGIKFNLRKEEIKEIAENIFLVGPIARIKPSNDLKVARRCLKEGDSFIPDPMSDEQVLVLKTPGGLLIITGCTHNGLENTIAQVKEKMGDKIFGVIGGLHLCDTKAKEIREIAHWLKAEKISLLGCCHCTGFEAASLLSQFLGDSVVFFNYVGRKTSIDLT
ncbi:MAG TPA: MBL fold metallo-hydrolase [Firmicutes bacterium]|nr:MBL fold metallo-hydrolase [Bacillota bacterium]